MLIKKNRDEEKAKTHGGDKTASQSSSSNVTGKGSKRKLLSPAEKLQMEFERQQAIDLYRQVKKRITS
jgi:hypothetical protein